MFKEEHVARQQVSSFAVHAVLGACETNSCIVRLICVVFIIGISSRANQSQLLTPNITESTRTKSTRIVQNFGQDSLQAHRTCFTWKFLVTEGSCFPKEKHWLQIFVANESSQRFFGDQPSTKFIFAADFSVSIATLWHKLHLTYFTPRKTRTCGVRLWSTTTDPAGIGQSAPRS